MLGDKIARIDPLRRRNYNLASSFLSKGGSFLTRRLFQPRAVTEDRLIVNSSPDRHLKASASTPDPDTV